MDKYQEALERAKKGLPMDEVFPELKESEDERIRKFLVELVSNDKANNYNGLYEKRGVRFDDVLAYLEKKKEQKPAPKFFVGDYVIDTNYKGEPLYQIMYIDKECYICEYRGDKAMGDRAVMHFAFDNPYLRLEQKPAEKITDAEIEQAMDEVTKFKVFAADLAKAFSITHRRDIDWHNFCAGLLTYLELNRPAKWSEEDKKMHQAILQDLANIHAAFPKVNIQPEFDWLKSLKDRGNFPKQEWSEDDEEQLKGIIDLLPNLTNRHAWLRGIKQRLKSLRPQPHWKPSEEQMIELMHAISGCSFETPVLESLYEQLKSL